MTRSPKSQNGRRSPPTLDRLDPSLEFDTDSSLLAGPFARLASGSLLWLRPLSSCTLQLLALLALALVYSSSRLLASGTRLSAFAFDYGRCFLRQFLSSLRWKALVPPKLLHTNRHGLPLLCTRVNSGSSDVAGGQHLFSWSCAARSAQAAAALRGVRSLDVGCRMTLWSDTFSVHSSAINCGLMIWLTHYPWPPAL